MPFLLFRESYSYRSNGALHAGSAYEANTWPETSREQAVGSGLVGKFFLARYSSERKYTNFLSSILFSPSFLLSRFESEFQSNFETFSGTTFLKQQRIQKRIDLTVTFDIILNYKSRTITQFIKEIAHCQGCAVPPR